MREMLHACNRFNAKHAIGDTIRCWPGRIEGDPVERTIAYPGADILGGHTPVVYVTGRDGCIALTNLFDGASISALPPFRVQLRRTKGWKMPPNTVKVDRSTPWGNPIRICEPADARLIKAYGWRFREPPEIPGTAAQAVILFEKSILFDGASIGAGRAALRGKNLACWCPLDQPCHADVWLRVVNAP